ncbi:hypothetical protein QJS10_CPB19g00848 [Acorus calamus]|uniref:Uncharacterized protein n=1 Tax=Acorus calamus TaxID=4465 RepID=A0AAV9CFN9_ACOCL|nr:hypothetical protein QJS10_CPB19g00848 [Acorus calamus]
MMMQRASVLFSTLSKALLKKPNTVAPFSSTATSNTGRRTGNSANRPHRPQPGKPNREVIRSTTPAIKVPTTTLLMKR